MLLWADLSSRFVWILLLTTLVFGAVGFYDDYLKLVVGNSKGLRRALQVPVQSLARPRAPRSALHQYHTSRWAETSLYVPFFKTVAIPMSTLLVRDS